MFKVNVLTLQKMNTLNFQATLSIDGNGNYMTFYFTYEII